MKGGRGQEGEPVEWTGRVPCLKRVDEENPGHSERDSRAERPKRVRKSSAPMPPRKASSEIMLCPYRKPTQVGRETSLQVIEGASAKELGKMTPYLWKKGGLSSFRAERHGGEQAARNGPNRLFTKNTGLCERESGSIGADSCPVPEGYEEW